MKTTEKKDIEQHRQGVAGEKAADVLELAHPRHRVAHAARLEVGERQCHKVAEQPGAQFDIDAARGVAEHIGAQSVQDALEDHHDDQTDDEYVECRHAFMDQHLVHHNLKKQRADQAEELQHEADQEHLAEQSPVFDQRRDEPREIELRRCARSRGPAGDEDKFAGPPGGKNLDGFDCRAGIRACRGGGDVLKQRALSIALRQQDDMRGSVVFAHHGQGGQSRQAETLDRGAGKTGFESQVFRGPQQVVDGKRVAGRQA